MSKMKKYITEKNDTTTLPQKKGVSIIAPVLPYFQDWLLPVAIPKANTNKTNPFLISS